MDGNNVSYKIALFRDKYLEPEKEYVAELMKQPKYKFFVQDLEKMNANYLAQEATRRINYYESGNILEEDKDRVHTEILLLLSSIKDCTMTSGGRELSPFSSFGESFGGDR
ncbi:MAG: hypothetical protein IKF97_05260 [Clostridia bacterium]|nr:hypothetical protein [Clostridia bacterium]